MPKSNVDFWHTKINRNIERDIAVRAELENLHWNVIVIWECDLKSKSRRDETLEKIAQELFDIKNRTYSHPCYPFEEAAEPEIQYGTDK